MSGGLVPSKSTVYVSNLPFDLKTNDLHKMFEKYGKIVKVTILKDKQTRYSKGVAFVLFLNYDDAKSCIKDTNEKEVFGRTLKCSIAKDNGRTTEFIRRKEYPDKSRCFECGEVGHLSYKCDKNLLGEREPPPKKVRKRKKKDRSELTEEQVKYFDSTDDEDDKVDEDCETLSAAIALEQEKKDLETYRYKVITGEYDDDKLNQSTSQTDEDSKPKRKIRKSEYFSDEEEID